MSAQERRVFRALCDEKNITPRVSALCTELQHARTPDDRRKIMDELDSIFNNRFEIYDITMAILILTSYIIFTLQFFQIGGNNALVANGFVIVIANVNLFKIKLSSFKAAYFFLITFVISIFSILVFLTYPKLIPVFICVIVLFSANIVHTTISFLSSRAREYTFVL